jgi:hypothetical protein
MAKTKISEFSATPGNNTDIDGINLAEGCAPSGINDAIRELMAQLKDFQAGTAGDSFNGPVGTSTAAAGAFTTLSATGVATFSSGTAGAPAITTTGDTNTGLFFPAADTVAAATGGTERLRLDSSGNLGLGVTPSGHLPAGYGGPMLQVGGRASILGSATTSAYTNNTYYASGFFRYIGNDEATMLEQIDGAFKFYTAPSGTAGNAISFTQAMTLDASGNLLVGTTSTFGFSEKARINGRLVVSDGSQAVGISSGAIFINGSTNNFANGYYLNVDTSNNLSFVQRATSDTERARITSGGDLLVGTTSANAKFYVSSASGTGSTNARFDLTGNSLTATNVYSVYTGTGNNNNNFEHFAAYSGDSGLEVFRVYGQGNVVNTNNSYGALSDIKWKENIIDATPKLEALKQVRVVNFNLIGDQQKQIGVIAQELEQIFPGMVEETADRDAEGNDLGTITKSVKYSVFVPMLIKAMQEQQDIINDLRARVAALEA